MTATEETAHGREPDPDLADVVRELSDRIEALQADVRRLGGPGLPASEPGWDDEPDDPAAAPSYAWVSAVSAPARRRPTVPRLLLEVLFLAGVATATAIANLDAATIAAVMAGAWVLVALIEWAASRADRARNEIPHYVVPAPIEAPAADPSWFIPPVEQTMLEPASDSPTAVTKLPPPVPDIDETVEQPARR